MRALLALLLLASTSGCIFGSGFEKECHVIIGYGNFTYSSITIGGSQSGAAFLSSTDELTDGQPSTTTRCEFVNGSLITSDYTRIGITINTPDGSNPQVGVIAIINVSLPVGTLVRVYDAASYPAPGSLIGQTTLQLNNNLQPSAWVISDDDNYETNAVFIEFVNNTGDITGGQEFTVGEIFAGQASFWDLKRNPKVTSAAVNKQNLSAAGVSFNVFTPRVRQSHFELSPQTQKAAFIADHGDPLDFESLVTNIMNSDVCAFIPFLTLDPAAYGTTVSKAEAPIVSKTAYLGQLLQPPTTSGDGDKFYDCVLDVQESI